MHSNNLATYCLAFVAVLASVAVGTVSAHAQTAIPDDPTIPEVHITRDGKVTISGVKVMQRAGTTFYVRTEWGDGSFIRWVLKTGLQTEIKRRYGDPMSVSEIKDGDYLYIEGVIESGSSLSVNAKKIIDWSDHTAQSEFSGTIKEVTKPSQQFTLAKANGQLITVFLSATSTTVYRNRRPISSEYLKVGEVISSIEGVYDYSKGTLLAQKVYTVIDAHIFQPQNYQGVLQSHPTGNPATFTLRIGGKDYTIITSSDVLILNKTRQTVTFDRWLAGDTVRVYGFIREDNDLLDTINASVVRDMNF